MLVYKNAYLITFFISTFLIYAGTPVAGIKSGHGQDTLLLGTIENVKNNTLTVNISYIFPQNKVWFLNVGDSIIVNTKFRKQAPDSSLEKENSVVKIPEKYKKKSTKLEPPTDGKKYLLSLNKETRWFSSSFYYPAWGMFEVEGTKYSDMELVQPNTFEHEALQVLINTGGLK